MTPVAIAIERERALVTGLVQLAALFGVTLREPLRIDTNGEFALTASNGTNRDSSMDPCGQFGELSRVLSRYDTRNGVAASKRQLSPLLGWCRMHHFEVERMLQAELGLELSHHDVERRLKSAQPFTADQAATKAAQPPAEPLGMGDMWQFVHMLASLHATGLTPAQYKRLTADMGQDREKIDELINKAVRASQEITRGYDVSNRAD